MKLLKKTLPILACLGSIGCSQVSHKSDMSTAKKDEPMNVIMVLVDDMNDWVEPLGGHPQSVTPNIQKLANKGMLFTNAHVSSPACHPSRVALMTGVHPQTSGVKRNVFAGGENTWRKVPVLQNATTLSQHFRDHGYEAIAGGKIYHTLQNNPSDENDPNTWDYIMPGDPKSGSPIKFQPRAKAKNVNYETEKGLSPNRIMSWAPMTQGNDAMADNQLVDWAIDELNKDREKPLFMAVGIFRPHLPWEVPKAFFDHYPLDQIQIPVNDPEELSDTYDHGRRHWHRWVEDNDVWRTGVQSYLASITYADYEVGRLMAALESSGKADNTIVVFWSDHGMHIGEKENWEKFTVFEESTRIPMIIVDPREKPGKTHAPSATIDLFPTLMELLNLNSDVPQPLGGESLANLVRGGNLDTQPAVSTYKNVHSVRSRDFRYIYNTEEKLEELYDHRKDPDEHTNIAYVPRMAAVMEEHRRLLGVQTGIRPPSDFLPPEAFEQDEQGLIRRKAFKTLDQVPYQVMGGWSKARRQKAIEKLAREKVPYTIVPRNKKVRY